MFHTEGIHVCTAESTELCFLIKDFLCSSLYIVKTGSIFTTAPRQNWVQVTGGPKLLPMIWGNSVLETSFIAKTNANICTEFSLELHKAIFINTFMNSNNGRWIYLYCAL